MNAYTAIRLDPGEIDEEFEVGSEPLCLEFVNTVGSRKGSHPHDWFSSYANLAAWGHLAGLLSAEQTRTLLRRADAAPEAAQAVLQRAAELRDAFYRLVAAHAAGQEMDPEDIARFNREIPGAYRRLRLAPEEEHLAWRWPEDPTDLDAMLWPVVRSAA